MLHHTDKKGPCRRVCPAAGAFCAGREERKLAHAESGLQRLVYGKGKQVGGAADDGVNVLGRHHQRAGAVIHLHHGGHAQRHHLRAQALPGEGGGVVRRQPCRGNLHTGAQPAGRCRAQAVHTKHSRRLQLGGKALQKLGGGKAGGGLYAGCKGRHRAHAKVLRASALAQMPRDKHFICRFRAQRVRRHGAVANAGHQHKPLFGQHRAQLACHSPHIGLIFIVYGGKARHVQRDITPLCAPQALAFNVHTHQPYAAGCGGVHPHAAGHLALLRRVQFCRNICINCHFKPAPFSETILCTAALCAGNGRFSLLHSKKIPPFFEKALASAPKRCYYKVHCYGY